MDELYLILTVVFSFLLGWVARERWAEYAVNKMLQNMKNEVADSDLLKVLNIDIVKEKDSFFVYNSDTQAFLVQVKTKEELLAFFTESYSNTNVLVKKQDLDLFDTL